MTTLYVVVHWRDACGVSLLDDAPEWLHKWKRQRRSACEAEIVYHILSRPMTCDEARDEAKRLNTIDFDRNAPYNKGAQTNR